MPNKRGDEDQIGYGKPPLRSRFIKGRSGNSKGRPSGTKNKSTYLDEALEQTVRVTQDGKRLTMTKLQAAVTQLANKAAAGDLRSIQILLAVRRQTEAESGAPEPESAPLDEIEQQVFDNLIARLRAGGTDGGSDNSTP